MQQTEQRRWLRTKHLWLVMAIGLLLPAVWPVAAFVLWCWAAAADVVLVDQTFEVGPYVVHETIHQAGGGWPDYTGVRRYAVQSDGLSTTLGDYENESMLGIATENPPQMVEDWLVVLSSNHVFLWQPARSPITFYPYDAENWNTVFPAALSAPNGHYDYVADQFLIDDADRWLMTYRCISVCGTQHTSGPLETLTFYSDDEGEHFYLMPLEAAL